MGCDCGEVSRGFFELHLVESLVHIKLRKSAGPIHHLSDVVDCFCWISGALESLVKRF